MVDLVVDLVLCHTTVDFDALGAAVAWTKLHPGARIVLAGGAHPAVQDFLALYRDELPLLERRSVDPSRIRSLCVVDTQYRERLGKLAAWLDLPQVTTIEVYDHHQDPNPAELGEPIAASDLAPDPGLGTIAATDRQVEPIGAATTLLVEKLMAEPLETWLTGPLALSAAEATVMALGIHVDTGSLVYETATARDAAALAWLMARGALTSVVADYLDPSLSPPLQKLLALAIDRVTIEVVSGQTMAALVLETPRFLAGLSSLAGRLAETIGAGSLLLGVVYWTKDNQRSPRLVLIGRSRLAGTDWGQILATVGGGGHAQAAAATVTLAAREPESALTEAAAIVAGLVDQFRSQLPRPLTARDLMSSPVRTIRPETPIATAERILLRYGHSGLSVVDPAGQLVGIVSRRDLDIALHHGFGHAPVKGYMSTRLRTIAPETTLNEIRDLMVSFDIGRLPVLAAGQLVGIVTRTDVLRQLHATATWPTSAQALVTPGSIAIQESAAVAGETLTPTLISTGLGKTNDRPNQHTSLPTSQRPNFCLLLSRFAEPLRRLLARTAAIAQAHGWQLYLVGGGVRDVLLSDRAEPLLLNDIDLVVDGCYGLGDVGTAAAQAIAQALQRDYPAARLQVHGQFQTAALLWHDDRDLGSLWVDIATARTEFYPYPAANPEVEASSIQQDLYRRDFTVNALAARLTEPGQGEILDFFGGWADLHDRQIRVLHANSFIEDPTRIFRAVRFASKLGFAIEPETDRYIRYALAQLPPGDRPDGKRQPALETRLKAELSHLLESAYWWPGLQRLADLGALRCLDRGLVLTADLARQVRLMARAWPILARAAIAAKQAWPAIDRWEMILAILLASLPLNQRQAIGQRLQLTEAQQGRLVALDTAEAKIADRLPQCDRPSQRAELLTTWDASLLSLIAVRSPAQQRRHIWWALTQLPSQRSPLNGNDLRQLGYAPGPRFRDLLTALRWATIDGLITDRASAITWLQANAPLG